MSVPTLHTLPTAVVPATGSGAATLTPTWTTATGSGTVAAGATSVSFYNSGSAAATVLGGSLPAGATLTLPAVAGCVWGAVAYDATGTTLLIVKGVAA